MNQCFLGLGSNIGDREQNVELMIRYLSNLDTIEIVSVSSAFYNPAHASYPQPDYLNHVIEIQTILSPRELLEVTQEVEIKMGRSSKGQYDPRTCDIDILFYNNEIISEVDLMVPHPSVHDRDFTLVPMAEISPNFVHPVLDQSISDLKKYHGF